jgi:CubicO group peptidase (beta-lactamase class C family)
MPDSFRTSLLLLALALSGCQSLRPPPLPAPPPPGASAEISGILAAILAEHPAPALVASIGHADGSIETGAVGVRKLGRPERVTPDDRFHIGSVTKPMTATVIAMLVDEGKLQWSTSIAAGLVIAVSANSATPEAEAATKQALKQLVTRYGGKAAEPAPENP